MRVRAGLLRPNHVGHLHGRVGGAVSGDILTEDELCPISGYWTRDGLKKWLTDNRITYVVAKNGWPRIHRKALERALGVAPDAKLDGPKEVAFNFDALK